MFVNMPGFLVYLNKTRYNLVSFEYGWRNNAHMTPMKIVKFSTLITPIVNLRPKFLWTSNFKRTPPPPPTCFSLNKNQSVKKNIVQEWLLYVIRSFLQDYFRFQHQLINLFWLSSDLFLFSGSLTIYSLVPLNSCVCGYPKI